jgi:hypothetical protein
MVPGGVAPQRAGSREREIRQVQRRQVLLEIARRRRRVSEGLAGAGGKRGGELFARQLPSTGVRLAEQCVGESPGQY